MCLHGSKRLSEGVSPFRLTHQTRRQLGSANLQARLTRSCCGPCCAARTAARRSFHQVARRSVASSAPPSQRCRSCSSRAPWLCRARSASGSRSVSRGATHGKAPTFAHVWRTKFLWVNRRTRSECISGGCTFGLPSL